MAANEVAKQKQARLVEMAANERRMPTREEVWVVLMSGLSERCCQRI